MGAMEKPSAASATIPTVTRTTRGGPPPPPEARDSAPKGGNGVSRAAPAHRHARRPGEHGKLTPQPPRAHREQGGVANEPHPRRRQPLHLVPQMTATHYR
jgi:hypothetical protein